MDIKGKRVLVIGSGVSGVAAAELLKKLCAVVVLLDGNQELDVEACKEKYPVFADAAIYLGDLPDGERGRIDLVVPSPGVPAELPLVQEFMERGIPVWGEIELAYRAAKGRIAAITGTNGKTTTTALTGEILGDYFSDVKVVGNIGIPYTSVAADTTEETVTVAEISSFQLETIHSFHPVISAILNITPDHLNRHHTMECYIAAKESITKNQGPSDLCVLNYEDGVLRAFGEGLKTRVLFFSSKRELSHGLYVKDGVIWYAPGGTGDEALRGKERSAEVEGEPSGAADRAPVRIVATEELTLLGEHNYENVMAATGIALGFGVPTEKIRETLKRFQAVEHRIEYVTEKRGVRYYNDSKGTNPDAAIKAVQAMNRPTLLIGGGYDKESDYDEWIESFQGKIKKLVLIGQTREKIAKCAQAHGFTQVVLCDTLEEAVGICAAEAKEGDAVLLSPACASWGMFRNYEERGRMFKEYVNAL